MFQKHMNESAVQYFYKCSSVWPEDGKADSGIWYGTRAQHWESPSRSDFGLDTDLCNFLSAQLILPELMVEKYGRKAWQSLLIGFGSANYDIIPDLTGKSIETTWCEEPDQENIPRSNNTPPTPSLSTKHPLNPPSLELKPKTPYQTCPKSEN